MVGRGSRTAAAVGVPPQAGLGFQSVGCDGRLRWTDSETKSNNLFFVSETKSKDNFSSLRLSPLKSDVLDFARAPRSKSRF